MNDDTNEVISKPTFKVFGALHILYTLATITTVIFQLISAFDMDDAFNYAYILGLTPIPLVFAFMGLLFPGFKSPEYTLAYCISGIITLLDAFLTRFPLFRVNVFFGVIGVISGLLSIPLVFIGLTIYERAMVLRYFNSQKKLTKEKAFRIHIVALIFLSLSLYILFYICNYMLNLIHRELIGLEPVISTTIDLIASFIFLIVEIIHLVRVLIHESYSAKYPLVFFFLNFLFFGSEIILVVFFGIHSLSQSDRSFAQEQMFFWLIVNVVTKALVGCTMLGIAIINRQYQFNVEYHVIT